MKLVCSFCKLFLGEKEPLSDDRTSHSVCSSCYEWFLRQEGLASLDDYLETFESPVIIVNDVGRTVAANHAAESILGKKRESVHGLLGGEVMECVYARMPEGCGNTAHCPACTIRNLVEETIEHQNDVSRKRVYLETDHGQIEMTVSTVFMQGLVSIEIREMH